MESEELGLPPSTSPTASPPSLVAPSRKALIRLHVDAVMGSEWEPTGGGWLAQVGPCVDTAVIVHSRGGGISDLSISLGAGVCSLCISRSKLMTVALVPLINTVRSVVLLWFLVHVVSEP